MDLQQKERNIELEISKKRVSRLLALFFFYTRLIN